MINLFKNLFGIFIVIHLTGCATISEPVKSLLGVSTKALEEAKVDAVGARYDCTYSECFDAVLSLGKDQAVDTSIKKKYYEVFQKNYKKGFIVVMGIPGQVDTTEVGVFLSEDTADKSINIQVSSLSTSAKHKAATAIFNELDQHFNKK